MSLAELRGFQNLLARHAELTVMLTGLRMSVVRVDRNAGEEAEPEMGEVGGWRVVVIRK